MKKQEISLFSLLYVDMNNLSYPNLTAGDEHPIDIYLKCGVLLGKSCRYWGFEYGLITNQKRYLDERLAALGLSVPITECDFSRIVPDQIPFYSAHFKLDLLRAFGTGQYGAVVGLLDLDMVMTRDLDLSLLLENELLVYDIGPQREPSMDVSVLLGETDSFGSAAGQQDCWYGGEFILGRASAFDHLSVIVDDVWPVYCENWRALNHVGDEAVVTSALVRLKKREFKVCDVGNTKMVTRWWSARTLNRQQPLTTYLDDTTFFHLPADKNFLAEQSSADFYPDEFLSKYKSYLFSTLWKRKLANAFLNFINRTRKHAARI